MAGIRRRLWSRGDSLRFTINTRLRWSLNPVSSLLRRNTVFIEIAHMMLRLRRASSTGVRKIEKSAGMRGSPLERGGGVCPLRYAFALLHGDEHTPATTQSGAPPLKSRAVAF